ncbi:MAG: hypothetical protein WBQ23_08370 [Bacteroidota bacterium]
MNNPIRQSVICILTACSLILACGIPPSAIAQQKRMLVLSPEVGPIIDSAERELYSLFSSIPDFHSASFYADANEGLGLTITTQRNDSTFVDSEQEMSYSKLRLIAERITHWEALKRGAYVMGSDEPPILFVDGSPLPASLRQSSAVRKDWYEETVQVSMSKTRLPLAPNPAGLSRPRFPSLRLGVSAGLMLPRVSELEPLIGETFDTPVFLALDLELPMSEYPELSLMIGLDGGFVRTHNIWHDLTSVASFSVLGVWRPEKMGAIRPILGVGLGHGFWQFTNHIVEIRAGYTYPVAILGIVVFEDLLDVVARIPMLDISTTYESKEYTIAPAGPSFSLRLSLD